MSSTIAQALREALARQDVVPTYTDDNTDTTPEQNASIMYNLQAPTPPEGLNNQQKTLWYVRHNPGITGAKLADTLKSAGHSFWRDTASNLKVLHDKGLVTRRAVNLQNATNSRTYEYWASTTAPTYTNGKRKKLVVLTPSQQTAHMMRNKPVEPVQVAKPFDPTSVIESLTFSQVMALYKHLRTIIKD